MPPANRRAFLVALPVLVACWAVGGLYASLGPSLLVDVFGIDNHLAGGLLILALNGTGVFGSLALRGVRARAGARGRRPRLRRGRGRHRGRPVHRVGDGAVRRRGRHRLRLRGRLPRRRRDHHRRGRRAVIAPGLLAGIFVVGYLAFSVPAIAAGIAVGGIGLERTAEIYGVAVIVLALSAAASLALRRRRDAEPLPAADEDTRAFAA